MNIFEKIFGGAKAGKLAGDSAVVSTLLQSIAVGADPATQVSKIRDIAGDSDTVFNGYLDELAACKGEDLGVVAKAVKIVDDYYTSHIAGDESKACPKCGKEPCVCDKAGDEKKPGAGDASRGTDDTTADLPKPEEKKPEEGDKEPEEKKQAGDSIDYDLLATKVVEKMNASNKNISGDTVQDDPGVALTGDQASNSKGSDDLMKDIWG